MSNPNPQPQATISIDTVLIKVFMPLLTALVCALGAWVWNTANTVTRMMSDLEHTIVAQRKIEDDQKNLGETVDSIEKKIYKMETDIEYIKNGVDELQKVFKK